MKTALLFITFIFSYFSLFAQQKDSVYISGSRLIFPYKIDTVQYLKFVYIDNETLELDSYERKADNSDLYQMKNSWKHYPLNIFAKSVNTDSLLFGKELKSHPADYFGKPVQDKYVFFEIDRFAVDERNSYYTKNGAWKSYQIDSLSLIALFDYDDEEKELSVKKWIIPMADGSFFSDGIRFYPPQEHNKDKFLIAQRRFMKDTDTININGKCGLYTVLGREIIPAVYDSLHLSLLVEAYKDGNISLIDYQGRVVNDDIKDFYPVPVNMNSQEVSAYQIIDKENKMYYMNAGGHRKDEFTYGFMSADDQLLPLDYDIAIVPPKSKNGKYLLIEFIFGAYRDSLQKDICFQDTIRHYGLDEFDTHFAFDDSDYKFNIWEIPDIYKDLKLINADTKFRRSPDYKYLNYYYIIAKKDGKYGMIDAREPDKPVLPFIYDKITPKSGYLILEKAKLKCYYPASDKPRYRELSDYQDNVARFRLTDGRKGWVGRDGKEFLDK